LFLWLWASSVAATGYFCVSMSGGMRMPGGWSMSMAWMRMPGQNWPQAAAMFMTMWLAMMVAMMSPSLIPILRRYRRVLRTHERASPSVSLGFLIGGYYAVYLILGAAAYPAGVALASAAMRFSAISQAIPLVAGTALVIAGIIQWTPWKMACLRRCRDLPAGRQDSLDCGDTLVYATPWQAARQGISLGLSCTLCCSGLMLALFVLGMMNPAVLLVLTSMISLERLLPKPELIVRLSGLIAIILGVAISTS